MASYFRQRVLQRILQVVPVVLLAITVVFFISGLIPGDPARLIAGQFADEEQVQQIREEYNLDKPLPVQYFLYFQDTIRSNYETVVYTIAPLMEDIKDLDSIPTNSCHEIEPQFDN